MSVRPWRAEIRFYKTGKMGPGNSGTGNLGSRHADATSILFRFLAENQDSPHPNSPDPFSPFVKSYIINISAFHGRTETFHLSLESFPTKGETCLRSWR